MNAEISETSNGHKPPKTVASTVLMLDKNSFEARIKTSYGFDARIKIY